MTIADNDTALPTVTISANDANASETGPDNGQFTVTRTGSTTSSLTVSYSVSGSATSGSDYSSIGTSVSIPAGSASTTITVTPINDTTVESSETVVATLSSSASYTIGSPSSATVTIADNDTALPTVTISANDANASETGPDNGQFTVTRTGSTTSSLTVNFSVSGSATSGSDYSSIGTSLTIPVGAVSATLTITPIDDTIAEGTESVVLTLVANAAYTLGSPVSATVNITDNDAAASPPELIGFLPSVGVTRHSVVNGNYCFIATATYGLSVVDVRDPQAPVVVGSSDLPFDGNYVAISGTLACVTGQRLFQLDGSQFSTFGFYVIDVSIPSTPTVLGAIESTSIGFNGVAISGNYAYVACGASGIKVINISNPAAPVIVGTYDSPGWAQSLTISGSYAYLADSSQGLRIVNISDPAAPFSVGFVDTPSTAKDVAVVGTIAYVADNTSLQIVDVSNVAAPWVRASIAMTALEVKVQNNTAYVAASSSGLITVNVSNPSSPVLLDSLPPWGGANAATVGVSLGSSIAYLCNSDGGLGIVNTSNPSGLSQSGSLMEWFDGGKIAVKPDFAVITGAQYWNGGQNSINGIRVLNIKNPAVPFVVGSLDSSAFGFCGVAVAGNYAYVACGGAGLKIVDISNPAAPTIVGTYDSPGWAQGVTVAGNLVYLADGTQGLRIIDVSSPTAPFSVGVLDTPGNAKDVAIVGTTAYVADNNSLQIVDVSNPAAPVNRGSYTASGLVVLEVKVQNNRAYLAASSGGLIIVDVTNPVSTVRLGSLPPSGGPNASTQSIAVNGSSAYLANFDGGLAIVDVSNPSLPVRQYSVLTVGSVRGVVADTAWIYLADSLGTIDTVYSGN